MPNFSAATPGETSAAKSPVFFILYCKVVRFKPKARCRPVFCRPITPLVSLKHMANVLALHVE